MLKRMPAAGQAQPRRPASQGTPYNPMGGFRPQASSAPAQGRPLHSPPKLSPPLQMAPPSMGAPYSPGRPMPIMGNFLPPQAPPQRPPSAGGRAPVTSQPSPRPGGIFMLPYQQREEASRQRATQEREQIAADRQNREAGMAQWHADQQAAGKRLNTLDPYGGDEAARRQSQLPRRLAEEQETARRRAHWARTVGRA